MPATDSDLYRFHCDNHRAVQGAFDRMRQTGRDAIRDGDETTVGVLTRSAALLLGMRMECRLKTILLHPGGFTRSERMQLERLPEPQKWPGVVDAGFRARLNVWRLDRSSMGTIDFNRRALVKRIISEALEPLILMRNTLAHGQWEHALNRDETNTNPATLALIRAETLETLAIKDRLVHHLSRIIEDLVTTDTAFDRDYTVNLDKLDQTTMALERADFARYRSEIERRHHAGIAARAQLNVAPT